MLHKTALATAVSVAVVVLAGATAVGANIGILDSGDDGTFGQLSAVSVPSSSVPTSTAPTGTSIAPTDTTAADPEVTTFDVEGIAAVTVSRDGTALTVVAVEPQAGWTWSVERDDGEVEVELRSATEEVDVYLSVVDGQVRTRVERTPLQVSSAGTAPPTGQSGGYEDDDEYEYEDEDDDEYQDHEDEDHEDEDHDEEYEGRDDDD